MRRLFPLLAFALLPAAVAAPVPPGGRVEFDTNGLLTRAELEKVRFDSLPLKAGEKFIEREREREEMVQRDVVKRDLTKPRPNNPYDVAVHMPWTRFREGEPIPAYFVLRNNRGKTLSLDGRLSLFGPEPATWNSCRIDVRNAKTRQSVNVLSKGGWSCGDRGLVDVPADGFYCVRGDLGHTADGKPLPPGTYEVDWRYGALYSAPVKFTVSQVDGKLAATAKRPAFRFYRIEHTRLQELIKDSNEPILWHECELASVRAEDMADALAIGGDILVPDIRTIPSADKYLEAWIEWKPYRDGDRVAVTLRARPPYERVIFHDVPQLHLQIAVPAEGANYEKEDDAGLEKRLAMCISTPLTIEAQLPADWRDHAGISGSARIAVLVTAKEIEMPRGDKVKHLDKLQDVMNSAGPADPPVWNGILRTDFVEVRFPQKLKMKTPR